MLIKNKVVFSIISFILIVDEWFFILKVEINVIIFVNNIM